jgi:hypothetical protein
MSQEQIEIIPITISKRSTSGSLKIYLAQLTNNIDPKTGRIVNPEEKWKIMAGSISIVGQNIANNTVLLFPELSLPCSLAEKFVSHCTNNLGGNTIVITGIELMTVTECIDLANDLGITKIDKLSKVFERSAKNQPINICFILLVSGRNKYQAYLQPKIIHSKFEGSLDKIKNLVTSDFIYHFILSRYTFMVLICSDLFRRPSGSLKRTIDYVDYNVLKADGKLDFIFNIQHNPSPDLHSALLGTDFFTIILLKQQKLNRRRRGWG